MQNTQENTNEITQTTQQDNDTYLLHLTKLRQRRATMPRQEFGASPLRYCEVVEEKEVEELIPESFESFISNTLDFIEDDHELMQILASTPMFCDYVGVLN